MNKRPKYYTWRHLIYAAYPDMSFYWCGGHWHHSGNIRLEHFETDVLPEYNLCHLCDVRAIFPNIKAHKRNDTVALGTEPATNPVSQQ